MPEINKRKKILIVDDEADLVLTISFRLKAAGYNVVTASDGVAAVERAVQDLPDLILLDIGLPGSDGYSVAAQLRQHGETSSVPIIFLTARSSLCDRKRSAAIGSSRFLTKPFKPKELIRIVSEMLTPAEVQA